MTVLARPRFSLHSGARAETERRISDRWSLDGAAVAYETGGVNFGRRHALRLSDGSPEGFGAIAMTPLPPGTSVVVGFSAPGSGTARGTVIRCLPAGRGYRVAIRLEGRAAA